MSHVYFHAGNQPPSNGVRTKQLVCRFLLPVFFALHAGCDQTIEAPPNQAVTARGTESLVSTGPSGEAILQECIQRYQSLNSYQDQATAQLNYLMDGQAMVEHVPMSVAWDRSGRLGLRAYDLIAGPGSSGRWYAKIEGEREEWAGQVLSRRIPERLSFDWLLTDPMLRQELSTGLAGFPPQLDLLLSPHPLVGLTNNASRIYLDGTTLVEERNCWSVVVEIGALTYRLAVDRESNLLRRIQLPIQNLPQAIFNDSSISDLELVINFAEAQVNHSIAWNSLEVQTAPGDKRLTRLVNRPAPVDLRGYGKIMPAFQLRSPDGVVAYDSRPKFQRKASVLIWLADHGSCRAAAEQLTRALSSLQHSGLSADAIEVVSVWAESTAPGGMTFQQLKEQWQLPGVFVLDNEAAGRDLFQIEEAPTLIVLDAKGSLQLRDVRTNPLLDLALPTLIQQIVSGKDLSQEIRRAQDAEDRRFQAELAMYAAEDPMATQSDLPDSYPPGQLQLQEIHRREFPSKPRLLFQDPLETPWILLADGSLNRLGTDLKIQQTYQTSWENRGDQWIHVVACSEARFFAHAAVDRFGSPASKVDLYDSRTGQEAQVRLPEESSLLEMCWLTSLTDGSRATAALLQRPGQVVGHAVAESAPPTKALGQWLAILTTAGQVVVYDWETKQQFSGQCSGSPAALIDVRHTVVLRDGTIEPMQLANPDNHVESGRNIRSGDKSEFQPVMQRLAFQPLPGTWGSVIKHGQRSFLAPGLLAASEPAIFFFDSQLAPMAHYRLPSHCLNGLGLRMAAAQSPGDGATVWALLDSKSVVHLVRGDGSWADHFRPGHSLKGLVLIAAGDRLNLLLSQFDQVVNYQLD